MLLKSQQMQVVTTVMYEHERYAFFAARTRDGH